MEEQFIAAIQRVLPCRARLCDPLFALQCLSLSDRTKFRLSFNFDLQPTEKGEANTQYAHHRLFAFSNIFMSTGKGHLLFVAHALISAKEVVCQMNGVCAVTSVTLNNDQQNPLHRDGYFVTSLAPMKDGPNELRLETRHEPNAKVRSCRHNVHKGCQYLRYFCFKFASQTKLLVVALNIHLK